MGKSKAKGKAKQPQRPVTTAQDAILTLVAALFLAGLRSFARACVHVDGSVATCATAGYVLLGLGALALVLCLMRLMAADYATRRSFDLLIVICGLLIALLPGTTLALCADVSMQCHTIMLPVARVAGAALVVMALACELTVDHEVPTGRRRRR